MKPLSEVMESFCYLLMGIAVVGVLLWLGASAAFGKTTAVSSTSDDQDWLSAHGMTTEAWLEVGPSPTPAQAKNLPDRCWHAKLFAAIRGPNGTRNAWAWEKGIVCSLDGRIDEYHLRHDKGSRGRWQAGPYPTIATQRRLYPTPRHVFTHYETSWRFGRGWESPIWGLDLNLHQYWSKRVARKVAWHHYASS